MGYDFKIRVSKSKGTSLYEWVKAGSKTSKPEGPGAANLLPDTAEFCMSPPTPLILEEIKLLPHCLPALPYTGSEVLVTTNN